MKVIGYSRVSTDEQGCSLDAQREAIQAEARRRGWDVEWIEDRGYSARSLKRPGIAEALDRLERGDAAALVVSRLDRLSRSVHDCSGLMRAALDGDWALVSLDPQVDMTVPYGRAMAHMAMVFAELERELTSQRIKEALAIKKANGVRLGRPRAVPDHVRERIVRERVDGATLRQIADGLNGEGVFIDVASWQTELARGTNAKRDGAAAELARAEAALATLDRREPKLRDRYIEAITEETDDPAIIAAYEAMIRDRDELRERVPHLRTALDAIPTEPPVDAVLDLYNELARTLKGGEGETLAALNVRLRAVFAEFRLETLPDDGVIGVLPVLHADVVERYGSEELAVIIGGEQVGVETAAATHPVALFATGEESVAADDGIDVAEHFALWRQDGGQSRKGRHAQAYGPTH